MSVSIGAPGPGSVGGGVGGGVGRPGIGGVVDGQSRLVGPVVGQVIRLGIDQDVVVYWDEELTLISEGWASGDGSLAPGPAAPAGSLVVFTIESTPIEIGRASADGTGYAQQIVTIPAGLEVGPHVIKGTGYDSAGNPVVLASRVIVKSTMRSARPALASAGGAAGGLNRRNAAILAVVSAMLIGAGVMLAGRGKRKGIVAED